MSSNSLSLRTARYAVAGACVLFLLQASPFLFTRWVEDESWYGSVAYSLMTEGALRNPTFADADLESQFDTRPPAMPISLAASIRVFGTGPVQFRIPSVLAGLGLVIMVFLLGLEVTNPTIAAVAAILAATDNFLFMTARTVRPDVYIGFFGAFAAWLFFRARRTDSWRLASLSGLVAGIGMNFHPNGIAIAASLSLLFLFEFRTRIFLARRFWVFALGILLSLAPFVIWLASNQLRLQAFKKLWGRGSSATATMLVAQEKSRYADFVGMASQRIPLPIHVPTRLHIAMALATAALLLVLYDRKFLGVMVVLIVPSLLLWVTEVNPTSRFFVIVTPYLALTLVAGVAYFATTRGRTQIVALVLLAVAVTQVGGNLFVLLRSRSADYSALTSELRRIIPDGAPTYGAQTFWLALHDRPYFSYNRTHLDYALQHGARYIIMNDRVMMHGTGYGENFYAPLREEVNAFCKEHGELAGQVHDPFYGDLDICRVPLRTALASYGDPMRSRPTPDMR